MPVKSRRNKPHRPREASKLGGLAVFAHRNREAMARQPMPAERQSNVCIAYHESVNALTAGTAEAHHLDTIIYAMNIGGLLVEQDETLGADHLDLIVNALAGAKRAKDRYLSGKGLGLDGDALVAIRAAYDLHAEQLRVATMGELEDAIDEMHRRVEHIASTTTDAELLAA